MSSLRDQIANALHVTFTNDWHELDASECHPCQMRTESVMAVVQPALDAKDVLIDRLKGEISHRSATSLEQQTRADLAEAALAVKDREIEHHDRCNCRACRLERLGKRREAELAAKGVEIERLTEERDAARMVSQGRTMEEYDQEDLRQRAEQAEAERDRLREAVLKIRDAKRRLDAAIIASAHRLDEPFTDQPEMSPWKVCKVRMKALDDAVKAALNQPKETPDV